jgi:hypothetical protein
MALLGIASEGIPSRPIRADWREAQEPIELPPLDERKSNPHAGQRKRSRRERKAGKR